MVDLPPPALSSGVLTSVIVGVKVPEAPQMRLEEALTQERSHYIDGKCLRPPRQ